MGGLVRGGKVSARGFSNNISVRIIRRKRRKSWKSLGIDMGSRIGDRSVDYRLFSLRSRRSGSRGRGRSRRGSGRGGSRSSSSSVRSFITNSSLKSVLSVNFVELS